MLRRIKFLVVMFAALCLPLHAVAAASMACCQLVSSADQNADSAACHDMPQKQSNSFSPSGLHGQCSTCSICYLAGAGVIPATVMLVWLTSATDDPVLMPLTHYQSLAIEPLSEPPRLSRLS